MTTLKKVSLLEQVSEKSINSELQEIADKYECRIEYLLSLEYTYLYKVKLTPAKWRKLMIRLEERGYVWQGDSEKPTTKKCPSNYLDRTVHIKKDKTLAYGQGSYAPGFNIKVEELNKLLDMNIPLENKNLNDFTIEDGVLIIK